MAIKFPLEMKNGVQARNISELKANFDVERVVGYFLDGKLKTWLDARYYEDEAEAVSQLDKDATNLAKSLCEIFGVEYEEEEAIDAEEIAKRNERIARLKQLTDDEDVIRSIDFVAFDQEELAELYDRGIGTIYLCEGEFTVPKSKRDLDYILIGEVVANGLVKEEPIETKEICSYSESIELTDSLEINSTEEKKYRDAKIKISSTIECSGSLEFENCEISCNMDKDNSGSFFLSTSAISIDSGTLRFKNCKIKYEGTDKTGMFSKTKTFISGENAKIIFDNCWLVGCKNLIGSVEDSDITFDSCTSEKIQAPIMTCHGANKIQVVNSTMTADYAPMAPVELGKYNMDALFCANADTISISKSTFEGFIRGVVCGEEQIISVSDSTFIECSAIVCGSNNHARVESCIFKKCIHLFKNENITLLKCEFTECFGKIEATDIQCESCNWKDGFVHFEVPHYSSGKGSSRFSRCTFENIHFQNSIEHLCHSNEHGYRYFSFMTDGEVDEVFSGINALIDAGHIGEISVCKFININVEEISFIITCGKYTNLEKSTFENCFVQKDILDRTVYTCFDVTKGLLFDLFDKGEKRQASYYIKNCKGIRE